MITWCFRIFSLGLLLTSGMQAQLSTSLKLSKKQYVAGEPVLAIVTITNHAGRPLTFASDGRTQWIDFMITDRHNEPVTRRGRNFFGSVTIRAGESQSRQFDLSQSYQLGEAGNFSVGALIHVPGSLTDGSATNRVLFNQSPGVPYWSQKVGIPSKPGQTREFRLLNFSGDEKAQIYAQVIDNRTGQNVRTFLLGDVLMLRKPLVTVDRQQRMHVMFLATPTMWVHCQIDTDGKLVERQIHQRGSQGDPQLITFADGAVRVANSIPYDPKAAAAARAAIRKTSERPTVTY